MQLLVIVLLVLALDQGTKYLVVSIFTQGQSIPLITNIFHLTYVKNPGAAFGLLAHKTSFFIGITVLVTLVILFIYRKVSPEQKLLRYGLALQLGGALGNLIDRVRTGLVVDFFDFRIWPVFNFADVAIVVGVALLAFELLIDSEDGKEV
ncbi:signal peptidase II [Metallumcola ferriviriculae]|uniref:Lipoprotein signal peptidase n=1 Tax=Metallumcola ferriviriculae TaxID=3039180 RepID=A0AAU0UQB6_9FIRM|nr:signal peptidase II [Desulfitibacteraceae bacterium MK1]